MYLLTDLRDTIKLTAVEEKILAGRLLGISFCELNKKETREAVDQIILRGSAITGCKLPQTDFFADFIAEEVSVFINDFGFSELTPGEILLALRLNECRSLKFPSGVEIERVEFSGHCFNIAYFSKVLANYKVLRNLLDRKFQNHIDGHA